MRLMQPNYEAVVMKWWQGKAEGESGGGGIM